MNSGGASDTELQPLDRLLDEEIRATQIISGASPAYCALRSYCTFLLSFRGNTDKLT